VILFEQSQFDKSLFRIRQFQRRFNRIVERVAE